MTTDYKPKLGWGKRLAGLTLAAVVGLGLFEAGTRLLVRGGFLETTMPSPGTGEYWDARNESFGVWRFPNATWRHQTPCFDVVYDASSVGARDVERREMAATNRVVVLGDSFIEGWGLPLGKRLSNLLESATNVEHLNFGMSHFGTYQQYLSYRDLAKRYTHDRLIVGVTPINDFFDLDYSLALHAPAYEFRYRPYLMGTYPSYTRFDYREPWYRRILRRYTVSFNAVSRALESTRGANPLGESPDLLLTHSFFYDFTDAQFDLMRYSLEQLVVEAEGKRVVVVLLPTFLDFARFYQMKQEESPLARRLKALGASAGFRVVDLMPSMFREEPHWRGFFFACDYHYNELGNRIAFESLMDELEGSFY
jgi:hypothetical protein